MDSIVVPEKLMVDVFCEMCFFSGHNVYKALLPLKPTQISSTYGSIVNDIYNNETYLLWGKVLVLKKNIYSFMKHVTNIDSKFDVKTEDDNQIPGSGHEDVPSLF